ncbi:MAG: hypothetical protein GXO35_04750 [Gammaproteobacteria bacterium]|nr:hypothetical protein [Gammaproteobacteria bacterium]
MRKRYRARVGINKQEIYGEVKSDLAALFAEVSKKTIETERNKIELVGTDKFSVQTEKWGYVVNSVKFAAVGMFRWGDNYVIVTPEAEVGDLEKLTNEGQNSLPARVSILSKSDFDDFVVAYDDNLEKGLNSKSCAGTILLIKDNKIILYGHNPFSKSGKYEHGTVIINHDKKIKAATAYKWWMIKPGIIFVDEAGTVWFYGYMSHRTNFMIDEGQEILTTRPVFYGQLDSNDAKAIRAFPLSGIPEARCGRLLYVVEHYSNKITIGPLARSNYRLTYEIIKNNFDVYAKATPEVIFSFATVSYFVDDVHGDLAYFPDQNALYYLNGGLFKKVNFFVPKLTISDKGFTLDPLVFSVTIFDGTTLSLDYSILRSVETILPPSKSKPIQVSKIPKVWPGGGRAGGRLRRGVITENEIIIVDGGINAINRGDYDAADEVITRILKGESHYFISHSDGPLAVLYDTVFKITKSSITKYYLADLAADACGFSYVNKTGGMFIDLVNNFSIGVQFSGFGPIARDAVYPMLTVTVNDKFYQVEVSHPNKLERVTILGHMGFRA